MRHAMNSYDESNKKSSFIREETDSPFLRTGIDKHQIIPKEEEVQSQELNESISSSSHATNQKPRTKLCQLIRQLFKKEYLCSRYSIIYFAINIVSIVMYIGDFVTDLKNALYYRSRGEENADYYDYFGLTLGLIIFTSVVLQMFSFYWEEDDIRKMKIIKHNSNDETKSTKRVGRHRCSAWYAIWVIAHIFQLGPLLRLLRTMWLGIKSRIKEMEDDETGRERYDNKYKREDRDFTMIRFIESFLESTPQLVLQIFIMLTTNQAPTITVVACIFSICGMATSCASLERALRNVDSSKPQLSIIGTIFIFLYKTFIILSRVLSLAVLLELNIPVWIGIFCGHWLFATLFVGIQKIRSCDVDCLKQIPFSFVLGFCYTFDYVNVKDPDGKMPNRWRMALYYFIIFIENTLMVSGWFYYHACGKPWIEDLVSMKHCKPPENYEATSDSLSKHASLVYCTCTLACFVLGITFMILYYLFFHTSSKSSCLFSSTDRSNSITSDKDNDESSV